MKKRVLISVGGTGGHVYPALALARELLGKNPEIKLMFVGGKLTTNRFFQGQPYLWKEVSCGAFLSKNPFKILKSLLKIGKGIWQSRRIISKFRPDLVVGFGSYHTFPTLVAAKLAKKQVLLHEANSIPGKVNRFLSRHVDVTGVNFPDAASYLYGTTVEVAMPLRQELKKNSTTREEALSYYNFSPDLLTLLVFGGSQGSKAINGLFSETLASYLIPHLNFCGVKPQVLHFTGDPAEAERLQTYYNSLGIRSCVKALEGKMNLALTAADFMISRAGAATISEQMEFEVPGILIPYPYATDKHQDWNAQFLVKNVGGALMFHESELTAEKLFKAINSLLVEDRALLKQMRQAIHHYKKRSKRIDLCSLVCELLES